MLLNYEKTRLSKKNQAAHRHATCKSSQTDGVILNFLTIKKLFVSLKIVYSDQQPPLIIQIPCPLNLPTFSGQQTACRPN